MKRLIGVLCLSVLLCCILASCQGGTAIKWYPMGKSGKSFYYGQTDSIGKPAGFIVYESAIGSTYYGVNNGGKDSELWDGPCIVINRNDDKVDSINIIMTDYGTTLHSTRYFADGDIIYGIFQENKMVRYYKRTGDKIRTAMCSDGWWGYEHSVSLDEVEEEWGLGYSNVQIVFQEKKEIFQHIGSYTLIAVSDAGKEETLFCLNAMKDGSVEYTLLGESWRYDISKNTYERIQTESTEE